MAHSSSSVFTIFKTTILSTLSSFSSSSSPSDDELHQHQHQEQEQRQFIHATISSQVTRVAACLSVALHSNLLPQSTSSAATVVVVTNNNNVNNDQEEEEDVDDLYFHSDSEEDRSDLEKSDEETREFAQAAGGMKLYRLITADQIIFSCIYTKSDKLQLLQRFMENALYQQLFLPIIVNSSSSGQNNNNKSNNNNTNSSNNNNSSSSISIQERLDDLIPQIMHFCEKLTANFIQECAVQILKSKENCGESNISNLLLSEKEVEIGNKDKDDTNEIQQQNNNNNHSLISSSSSSSSSAYHHQPPHLGVSSLDSIFRFVPGYIHEIYGEAGCGKSTWAAQLLVHTIVEQIIMNNNENNKNSNSQNNNIIRPVVYLCAETHSSDRLAQIAEVEIRKYLLPTSSTSMLQCSDILEHILIMDLPDVSYFEFSVRDLMKRFPTTKSLSSSSSSSATMMRGNNRSSCCAPLIILDSAAALVEKSLPSGLSVVKNNNTFPSSSSSKEEGIRNAMNRQEIIERVGNGLKELSMRMRQTSIIVINQARADYNNTNNTLKTSSSFTTTTTTTLFRSNNTSNNNNNNSTQAALGYAWSLFITGMCLELTKVANLYSSNNSNSSVVGNKVMRQRRRARMMKNSFGEMRKEVITYDLVEGGVDVIE